MKLTEIQREQVKDWIKLCRIQGLSIDETKNFVNEKLAPNYTLSRIQILKYMQQLRLEARSWLSNLAVDVCEYIHILKERWDELHELKRNQWALLVKATNEGDSATQIKAALVLSRLNDQIMQMSCMLPQISLPTEEQIRRNILPSKVIEIDNGNGNGNNNKKPILGIEDVP